MPDKEVICNSIFAEVSYLKAQYQKIALVTHERHVVDLDPEDKDTLIISCDWLLWQKCLNKGMHCIYYEAGLVDWTEDGIHPDDLLIRSNDWVFVDDEDITLFNGVSLGKQFIKEVSMFAVSYIRLERSLRVLTEKYRPKEFIFYDFRNELGMMDVKLTDTMVRSIADHYQVKINYKRDPMDHDDPELPQIPLYVELNKKKSKSRFTTFYTRLMDITSRFRSFISNRDYRIFFIVGSSVWDPLYERFNSNRIFPVLLTHLVPHKKSFIFNCMRKGVLSITPPEMKLNRDDIQQVDSIIQRLKLHWKSPAEGLEAAVRYYVQKYIFDNHLVYHMATEVKKAKYVMEKVSPCRVVLDGVAGPPQRIYLELANKRGIPTDYVWHSIFVHNTRFESLGCDSRTAPLVTRCLTWGKENEDWIDNIGAKTKKTRIGSPVGDTYRRIAYLNDADNRKNVLLLQYTPGNFDFKGLNANQYEYFVNLVRSLHKMGYSKIRMKLHAGLARKEYYERISRYFGLGCPIFRDGPFADFVKWSDFVIGPVLSGAFFEVISSGKCHYPFLLSPHTVDTRYLKDVKIHSDIFSLRRTLEEKEIQNPTAIMNYFYDFENTPNASKRFWEVLENDIA